MTEELLGNSQPVEFVDMINRALLGEAESFGERPRLRRPRKVSLTHQSSTLLLQFNHFVEKELRGALK